MAREALLSIDPDSLRLGLSPSLWPSPTKLVAGAAGLLALFMVLAIQRWPLEAAVEVPPPTFVETRESRWDDVIQMSVAQKKADAMTPLAAITDPKPVTTERVLPVEKMEKIPLIFPMPDEEDDKPVQRTKRKRVSKVSTDDVVESNVCTKHKMKKVVTRDGKSWRCKR